MIPKQQHQKKQTNTNNQQLEKILHYLPNMESPVRIRNEIKRYHKEFEAYCYSWTWELKAVSPYEMVDYVQDMLQFSQIGLVKRCTIYSKCILKIKNSSYLVRLESFGHSKRQKMLLGVNPIAYAFDKLLLDYVYVFLEDLAVKKKTLISDIKQEINSNKFKQALRNI